jgi:hypothetical protein
MSEFVSAAPPSGGITWADHKGKLLIAEPLTFEAGINTAFGTADAVKANIHVLTGPDEAEDYPEALVFPKLLASQLKGHIGSKVVGRLGQGAAKPGQSAPWLLEEASADDLEKAKAWLEKQKPALTSAAPAEGTPPF